MCVLHSATSQDVSQRWHKIQLPQQPKPWEKTAWRPFCFPCRTECSPQSHLPREPCSDSSCDLPCTWGTSTLPLQTRAQHSPWWEVLLAPALVFRVRCQPPAPLKMKRARSYSNHSLGMFTLCCKVIKKPGKSVKDEKRPALSSMVWWTDGFCCISLSSNWIYLCNLHVFVSAIEIFFCPCSLQFPSPFLIVIWAELYFRGKFVITESKRQGGGTPTVQTNGSADWCQNVGSA